MSLESQVQAKVCCYTISRKFESDMPTFHNSAFIDFTDLPLSLLKMALVMLVKQNKAQIFQASQGGDGEGVKFFS